jgi:hypothetical protein
MNLAKTWSGMTPFITNVTVFNATVINKGAFLVSGATSTAQGATITIATTTVDGQFFIGVTQEATNLMTQSKENLAPNTHAFRIPSSGIPNTGTNSTAGLCYAPLTVNPDASYYAYYSTTTGAGTASNNVATWTASTTTNAVRGTTGVDVMGGWVFSLAGVNSAGATPTYSGSLRYIANTAATTSLTFLTAMNISTDSHMTWIDRTWKKGGTFTTTADFLRSHSGSSGTGFQLNGAQYVRIENYINADHAPSHALRSWVDDGLNGLTGVEFFTEVRFIAPFVLATELTA